jgi:hypothetical protein
MNHTPGPWHIATGADHTPLVMAGGVGVAHVYMQRFAVGRGAKQEETDANARLIAAAPDLLFQLEGAARQLERDASALMADKKTARRIMSQVDGIRAAIAKATGEPK